MGERGRDDEVTLGERRIGGWSPRRARLDFWSRRNWGAKLGRDLGWAEGGPTRPLAFLIDFCVTAVIYEIFQGVYI